MKNIKCGKCRNCAITSDNLIPVCLNEQMNIPCEYIDTNDYETVTADVDNDVCDIIQKMADENNIEFEDMASVLLQYRVKQFISENEKKSKKK